MGLHVKKGDLVYVASGKDKGKTGKVLLALPSENKVVVEGVNVVKKHVKANANNPQGGIEEREAALHASKVRLVDPETGKPTRARKQIVDGKKVRVATKSGKVID
ncbi:50S ribosomal protein L24 [Deinococcus cellulosilyticus]|uniref:Large ribosomal subunit protein uL24 n=1 Tax=Deinococcus cellulosilyticus (strain DSM 18568 / NBRC 106333 / KACC 11606 / 5516J-15) TaxID=1223518 RepID=A0A511N706_DEIC1|nr:50S ribosomal protein L24 [Deinococcus cellulosilyticus]GEM48625.1 50S ribosomal protein L24 [Deinococcus cellulosilyticus NBRC 106333 = KACC 11606]